MKHIPITNPTQGRHIPDRLPLSLLPLPCSLHYTYILHHPNPFSHPSIDTHYNISISAPTTPLREPHGSAVSGTTFSSLHHESPSTQLQTKKTVPTEMRRHVYNILLFGKDSSSRAYLSYSEMFVLCTDDVSIVLGLPLVTAMGYKDQRLR